MTVRSKELQRRLQQEKERLSQELEQLKASAPPLGETGEGSPFGKREEEATEAFELEKRMALEKQFKGALLEVEHALGKFPKGTYGLCESCGQPIDRARLEILPQATLCLICKTRLAKSAKGKFSP